MLSGQNIQSQNAQNIPCIIFVKIIIETNIIAMPEIIYNLIEERCLQCFNFETFSCLTGQSHASGARGTSYETIGVRDPMLLKDIEIQEKMLEIIKR